MSGFEGSENNLNNDFQNQNLDGQEQNFGSFGAFSQGVPQEEPYSSETTFENQELVQNFQNPQEEAQEEQASSRLEELLSSYDPNLELNENSTFNIDVSQVVEEVVKPAETIKREPTVEADTSISLGETFDKQEEEIVTVQPIKFANFENDQVAVGTPKKNLDIMQDIMIKVTVELGRCKMKLKKVLDIQKGSIIEINKVAGEQVELFVSGKLVAIGEVIVMEDKFGLRITSIVEDKQN
jgi:flagellar motor switch protein FliN